MREDRFELLMNAFAKMVSAHTALTQIFGVI
jgi:hypothetical protein